MYFNDHEPAHFHAIYGEFKAHYAIPGLKLMKGEMPNRAHNLIIEWASQHLEELMTDWNLTRSKQPLYKIEPLA
jgi:hypothetical protein